MAPDRKINLFHRGIIILLLRLTLGGLFIYASLHKIRNTIQFKDMISKYEILPYWMINITSIVLPWLEFLIGALLIIGIFVRSCAIIQCSLLITFILAISLNIARGLEIYCGCFTEDSIISSTNYWHVIFNGILLMMVAILFVLERRRFSHRFFSRQAGQR